MTPEQRRKTLMRRLHRSVGATAAAFVLFMVMSGLAINHSNDFGLDQRHLSQPLLLDWYGLDGPENIQSFPAGNAWLSFAGSRLFLNDKPVATVSNGRGAVLNGEMLIAAGSDELLLLDPEGNLIERLPWGPAGAGPIDSLGLLKNARIVVASAGQLWLADKDVLSWQRDTDAGVSPSWATPATAPAAIQQGITRQYRGTGPSLERFLLDLHSGRFFGPAGVLIYDLMALAIAFLAISGLLLWVRGRRNGR
jgi:hypothetical protein